MELKTLTLIHNQFNLSTQTNIMSRRYTIFYLRKHRKKLIHPHYRANWELSLTHQEAIRTFKRSLQQNNNNTTLLLPSLLHSFSLFKSHPTPIAYHFLIIRLLSCPSRLHQIPQVLDHIQDKEDCETPEFVFVHLIKLYGELGRREDALHLFSRIPRLRCTPSAESLDALLSVLCRDREGLKWVPRVLRKSVELGIRFEESTVKVLIAALCRVDRAGHAIDVFNCAVNVGFTVDPEICSLLLSSLCNGREPYGSLEVMGFLGELRKLGFSPAVSDFEKVIRFLVDGCMGVEALDVLSQMKSGGIKPDINCYTMVIRGMVEVGDYAQADKLFDELLVLGLVPDVCTYNAFIKGLCKQNKVEEGLRLVGGMEELGCRPDSATYNALLEGLCENGEIAMANKLLREMESKGISHNTDTYKIIVDGLFKIEEINEGCALLEEAMEMALFSASNSIFDEIAHLLCKRGMMCKALELLQKMVCRNVSPGAKGWEALILNSGLELSFQDYQTWISVCGSESRSTS